MGDHADDALDSLFDTDELYCRYRDLPPEELPEEVRDLIYDELGAMMPGPFDHISTQTQYPKKCKYCGKTSLRWKNTANGWRLYDRFGIIHLCLTYDEDDRDDFNAKRKYRK